MNMPYIKVACVKFCMTVGTFMKDSSNNVKICGIFC